MGWRAGRRTDREGRGGRRVARRLGIVVAGVVVLVVLAAAPFVVVWAGAARDTSGQVAFDVPLPVPPLAGSVVEEDGTRVFRIEARAGSTEFVPGVASPTWGFDGDLLGPTLRAARGERVRVEVTNSLEETTSVHWHGMHLPAVADGGPHQPIGPGATWSPSWSIDQPAATLWYHPHVHGTTEQHAYRGLAGMFLVDDEQSHALGLPQRYGVDDVPLVVADRELDDTGRLVGPGEPGFFAPSGHLGNTVTVNGLPGTYLDVTAERVRLRLLNASSNRSYAFGMADGRDVALVAGDGGLLPAPHRTDRVLLSPGERAEIVVDVVPGERTVLRSFPHDLGSDPFNQRFAGGDDTLDVMELRAAPGLEASAPLPEQLAAPGPEPVAQPATTRQFEMAGTVINGLAMDMDRIDFGVERGTPEIWEVVSVAVPHNFHVHGTHFRVLEVGGSPPPPELGGWKDTLYLRPETTYRLLVRFDVPADPDVPFMLHCHLLSHEDAGMMIQFAVVEPGQEPAVRPAGGVSGDAPGPVDGGRAIGPHEGH